MSGETFLLSAAGGMPSKGIIDMLQQHGVTVVGIDADPYAYGLQYLDRGYVVPRGDAPGFTDTLLEIVKEENVDALLLSPESEVLAVAEERGRFEAANCLPLVPAQTVAELCADKVQTHRGFQELGVPTPERYDNPSSASPPCIVKPRYGRGSRGINVARTAEEISFYAAQLEEPIIEEFVSGEEYTVDVLADRSGTVLSVVPRKRVTVRSGKSVTGRTVDDERVRKYCREIASEWGLFGPSCIQCIRDEDGPKFLEVNTRFGGGAILSMHADESIIPNLLRLVRGESVTPSNTYQTGLVMLRNYEQLFVDREHIDDRDN